MRFEWDPEKDRGNRKKHGGLAFETAALVFNDPQLILRKDCVLQGEQRGMPSAPRIGRCFVVHVYRTGEDNDKQETIRIISAREANQRERRVYLQQGPG